MTDVFLVSNGTILTMDPAQPEVEAFGVIGDRIVAVGNRRLVEDALPRGCRTVDLAGRCAVPGFNEAHNHMISYGLMLEHIDASFPTVNSIRDIVSAVRERAATTPNGRWIIGRGLTTTSSRNVATRRVRTSTRRLTSTLSSSSTALAISRPSIREPSSWLE